MRPEDCSIVAKHFWKFIKNASKGGERPLKDWVVMFACGQCYIHSWIAECLVMANGWAEGKHSNHLISTMRALLNAMRYDPMRKTSQRFLR